MGGRFIEKCLEAVKTSSYARVMVAARKMEGVLNLQGGDPDFDIPGHIQEAAVRTLGEGWIHYPVTYGMPALREAIAEYHGRYRIDWKPSEVIVTAGSAQSLYACMAGTINPGEQVVLPEPHYSEYHGVIEYLPSPNSKTLSLYCSFSDMFLGSISETF